MKEFLGGKVILHSGDCLDVLDTLAENSVDSCVTDPPYHLASDRQAIRQRWLGSGAARERWARASAGFMGKAWDGGDVAFRSETWGKVLRVLKPGAHLVAFAAPKNSHRMVCAIEDAGFEIRDSLMWMFGTGFPKSHDVSKAIDKAAGAEGTYGEPKSAAHASWISRGAMRGSEGHEGYQRPWMDDTEAVERAARKYVPATPEAAAWGGWGTALKSAYEPICLARKPLSEPTIAANVLRWRTGALNIARCRIGDDGGCADADADAVVFGDGLNGTFAPRIPGLGRWPANVLHDGSDEVVAAFPNSGSSAARFFWSSKADSDDRLGSRHPTIKPLNLIQWLVRLITPPKGLVLDCFAGTGTTAEAAFREGMRAVLIEREAEYQADIERRMGLVLSGPDARSHATIKARGIVVPPGPATSGRTNERRGTTFGRHLGQSRPIRARAVRGKQSRAEAARHDRGSRSRCCADVAVPRRDGCSWPPSRLPQRDDARDRLPRGGRWNCSAASARAWSRISTAGRCRCAR